MTTSLKAGTLAPVWRLPNPIPIIDSIFSCHWESGVPSMDHLQLLKPTSEHQQQLSWPNVFHQTIPAKYKSMRYLCHYIIMSLINKTLGTFCQCWKDLVQPPIGWSMLHNSSHILFAWALRHHPLIFREVDTSARPRN